jgi:2-desacetyl-2-hydroxyethyl bacteriochlorophyllide A dehydrogenase
MKRTALIFTAPGQISLQEEPLEHPGPDELLVQSIYSAISPGTEMLLFRGEFSPSLALDETIRSLEGRLEYPFKYGYATVGRVIEVGASLDDRWEGALVFAFHPHESLFLALPEELIPLPPGIDPEEAVFLPNTESAVNFIHDGGPLLGEQVAVFGQGVVGLLTTALLSQYPLSSLVTLDPYQKRRQIAQELGAHISLDPDEAGVADLLMARLQGDSPYRGADLTYELSGSPNALDMAIAVTGFHGRIVIGSWYGTRRARLPLGGRFHRSRIQLLSSQVSTINPQLSGRWGKPRRLAAAWSAIKQIGPKSLITHRIPFEQAPSAYQRYRQDPEDTLQILLTY